MPCRRAFTLVELLVVIVIIGVLASLGLPAFNSALQKAHNAQSASNLRQIGVALNNYAGDHNGIYPLAGDAIPYQPEASDPSTWPWQQQIEDYIGRDGKVFKCPNVPNLPYGYYMGVRAAFIDAGNKFAAVNRLRIPQLSKHILAGEALYWASSPTDADQDDYTQTPSFQQNGQPGKKTPILLADGHVDFYDHFDKNVLTANYAGIGTDYPWSP